MWAGADLSARPPAVARGARFLRRPALHREPARDRRRGRVFDEFLRWPDAPPRRRSCGATRLDSRTEVGPLVSRAGARPRFRAVVESARVIGRRGPRRRSARGVVSESLGDGAYEPPTLVVAPPHESEIVQQETLAPRARRRAGVGLRRRARSRQRRAAGARLGALRRTRSVARGVSRESGAGVLLKWNASTADADAVAPFGGWKASGLGPPERGRRLEFYTRAAGPLRRARGMTGRSPFDLGPRSRDRSGSGSPGVADRVPDRPAVVEGESVTTYAELASAARRIALRLRESRRAGPGPVALLMPPGAELFAAMLGALEAGRFYVPLDPTFPERGSGRSGTRSTRRRSSRASRCGRARGSSRTAGHRSGARRRPLATARRRHPGLPRVPTTWPTCSSRRARRAGPKG